MEDLLATAGAGYDDDELNSPSVVKMHDDLDDSFWKFIALSFLLERKLSNLHLYSSLVELQSIDHTRLSNKVAFNVFRQKQIRTQQYVSNLLLRDPTPKRLAIPSLYRIKKPDPKSTSKDTPKASYLLAAMNI